MRKGIIFSIALIFMGCVKPEPEEVVSLPSHFSLSGTLNGEAFDMTPGENGFYLFTDLADHNQGRVDFAATSAHLTDDSAPWISFELIMDGGEDDSSADLIDEIEEGELDLGISQFQEYDIVLTSDNEMTLWVMGGGDSIFGSELEFGSDETETIFCGSLDCENGIMINPIGFIGCTSSPTFNVINIQHVEDDLYVLIPPVSNSDFDLLIWEIGDETVNSGANEPVYIEAPPENELEVQLLGGFLENNPYIISQTFIGFESDCPFPFIESGIISEEEPIMRVTYFNGADQLYTSELICDPETDQPGDAFFEVLSMEDFSANENGLPTKKMTFSTKLLLKNDLTNPIGETLLLEIEEGSIAFPFEDE